MVLKMDKQGLSKLLSDAIPMLCKNSLPLASAFRVEAMIGLTLLNKGDAAVTDNNVVLICFNQTVDDSGSCIMQPYGNNSFDDVNVEQLYGVAADQLMDKKLLEVSSATSSETVGISNAAGAIPGCDGVKRELDLQTNYDCETINLDDDEALEAEEEQYDDEDQYEADCSYQYDPNAINDNDGYLPCSAEGSVLQQTVKREAAHFEGAGFDISTENFVAASERFTSLSSPWRGQGQVQSQMHSQHFTQGRVPQRTSKSNFGLKSVSSGKLGRPKNKLVPDAGRAVAAVKSRAVKSLTSQSSAAVVGCVLSFIITN